MGRDRKRFVTLVAPVSRIPRGPIKGRVAQVQFAQRIQGRGPVCRLRYVRSGVAATTAPMIGRSTEAKRYLAEAIFGRVTADDKRLVLPGFRSEVGRTATAA